MTLTEQDIGRIICKRDNPMRRFDVLNVTPEGITLKDRAFGMIFIIQDASTYVPAR
jgi:hypothetical protein